MTHFRNKKTGEVWVKETFGPPYVSTPVVVAVVAGLLVAGFLLAFFGSPAALPEHHPNPKSAVEPPTNRRTPQ